MTDYILKEDVLMALTGDITDCTIEEFIARLRDKLSKLPSVSVDDVINQRATTCRHGGHCEWVACDKCNHYEPELVNDSQDLDKDLVKGTWKDYAIAYRQGGYSCAVGTCPKCGTRQEVDRYCSHCGERLEVENADNHNP